VVAGVERLGRVGNLVGGVAAEALDAGVRPSTASASMEMPLLKLVGSGLPTVSNASS